MQDAREPLAERSANSGAALRNDLQGLPRGHFAHVDASGPQSSLFMVLI